MGEVVSGAFGYLGAKKQAAATKEAAIRQQQAAEMAAEEARFRPVGITTRFGTATPQFTDGRLSGYSYEAAPELQALQQQLSRIYGGSLGQAERAAALQPQFEQAATGLMGLGQQYLATTPEEARQKYMQQQLNMLRPYDIEQEQRLASSVFGRGRGGLSVGAGGQPELQALAESRARRNLALAANAEQAAQQQIGFGAGLFGTGAGIMGTGYQTQQAAMQPFFTQFGTAQQLEEVAQSPMQIGASLGAKTSQFGSQAGQMLQSGYGSAADLQRRLGLSQGAQMAGFGQRLGEDINSWLYATQSPAPIEDRSIGSSSSTNYAYSPNQTGWFSPENYRG